MRFDITVDGTPHEVEFSFADGQWFEFLCKLVDTAGIVWNEVQQNAAAQKIHMPHVYTEHFDPPIKSTPCDPS